MCPDFCRFKLVQDLIGLLEGPQVPSSSRPIYLAQPSNRLARSHKTRSPVACIAWPEGPTLDGGDLYCVLWMASFGSSPQPGQPHQRAMIFSSGIEEVRHD